MPRALRSALPSPGSLAAGAYAALLYGFILLPVLVLVLFSFQDSRLPVPPFDGPSLRWYGAVFDDPRVMAALGHSLLVALGASAVSLLLGFLAAYGLARHRLPGARGLQLLLTAPLTVSYLIIAMGLLITFNSLGVPRSLWTVGIGHVVINLPLCFAILYSQMGGHQAQIERAARDLGAAEHQVLLLVTVPLLWPALFACFFLSFTFSWDEFLIAFLTSRFDVTLPVEIWSMLRSGLNPKTNAVGSFVFLISVALVLLLELVVFGRKRR
ncbi:spermidine/putrescine transport system permease protein [Tistlia consotensis]|uniref:Spermidine/putrescine transport system permease protein n=1 Tax=Tistlia consotensis USBA 355 TaxID=560819 RepID=A0A1Y6C8J1_9PROT|nr:ABC transporter permease [Tistlia consotensis]SMF51547.1 spermidine/putrescine transport system permease protein [Tistlia consotensis USBA 355]SNR84049.1 spermidine/putrescine transport system permease protein [Tistlia consotensis]